MVAMQAGSVVLMPDSRIVVFGATGYTGRLVTERLVAAGASPVLAGRNPERLRALADTIGADLEVCRADVMRKNSVFEMVQKGDVLVSTVGPFAKWGEPAVRAAIAASARYIDSTGEPAFIRRVFEEFGPPAASHGATLMTAMGYDWVPGQLAGALALEEAGEAATRVDVGYYSFGVIASDGTKTTAAGALLDPVYAFRSGGLVTERTAARVRSFDVKGRSLSAMSIGTAEHFSLPAAYPQLRDVNVHVGIAGPLARAVQAGSLATSMVTKLPGTKTVLRAAGERLATLGPSPEPGTTGDSGTWVVAVASDERGEPLAEVALSGGDVYAFTAGFIAWAARRAAGSGVEGVGAIGPLQGFGLQALEAGCAEAGMARAGTSRVPTTIQ
jgi:short subunit dehydrogenase-like uncharacterized protein